MLNDAVSSPLFQTLNSKAAAVPMIALSFTAPDYLRGAALQREFEPATGRGVDPFFCRNFSWGLLGDRIAEVTYEADQGRFRDTFLRALIGLDGIKATGADLSASVARYEEKIARWFQTGAARANRTELDVYRVILDARRHYFRPQLDYFESLQQKELLSYAREQFTDHGQGLSSCSRESLAHAAVFAEYGTQLYERALKLGDRRISLQGMAGWPRDHRWINDWAAFDGEVLKRRCLVHVLGTINTLTAELVTFAQLYLRERGPRRVYLAAKTERVGREAALADVQALLELPAFNDLRQAQQEGRLILSGTGLPRPGLDFRALARELPGPLELVRQGRAVLSLSGEANCESVNGIGLEHFRFFPALSIESQRISGRFWRREESIATEPVILRVPPGLTPYARWGGKLISMEDFRAARQLFEHRHAADLEPAYAEVRRLMHENSEHFVEVVAPELLARDSNANELRSDYALQRAAHRNFYEYLTQRREDAAARKARELVGEQAQVIQTRTRLTDGTVLVSGAIMNQTQWEPAVFRAADLRCRSKDSYSQLVSFERLFGIHNSAELAVNGLYFLTPLLLDLYNQQRHDRPGEQLRPETANHYLDGFRLQQEDGSTAQGLPLYNKGLIGVSREGRLMIGRHCLGGGALRLGSTPVSTWRPQDVAGTPGGLPFERKEYENHSRVTVNADAGPVVMYTPLISRDMLPDDAAWLQRGRCPGRDNGYTVAVGHGRVNLIVVNNQIQAVVDGPVLQPSCGLVLSLTPTAYAYACRACGGDLLAKRTALSFELERPPAGSAPKWYLGGGTLLVDEGRNLVATQAEAYRHLAAEGWFKLLSMQTQETQVQDWVRGARTIIGLTAADRMAVFCFSGGRGGPYCGARFDEAIEIIQKHLRESGDELRSAINLDGGSSSALALRAGAGVALTLNRPSTGPDNIEGKPRWVSELIYFRRKLVTAGESKQDSCNFAAHAPYRPPSSDAGSYKIDYENHWMDTWEYR